MILFLRQKRKQRKEKIYTTSKSFMSFLFIIFFMIRHFYVRNPYKFHNGVASRRGKWQNGQVSDGVGCRKGVYNDVLLYLIPENTELSASP